MFECLMFGVVGKERWMYILSIVKMVDRIPVRRVV